MTNKLYKVTLRGMTSRVAGGTIYGIEYVVARDPQEAVCVVQSTIKEENVGCPSGRELDCVELLAEENTLPRLRDAPLHRRGRKEARSLSPMRRYPLLLMHCSAPIFKEKSCEKL
jgi:hypothetical protein